MSSGPEVRQAVAAGDVLGESPLWDDRHGVLRWIDVKRCRVAHWDPRTVAMHHVSLPWAVGCIALTAADDGVLVAGAAGIHRLDHAGELHPVAHPEPDRPANRCNDGRVDANGVLWVGTMNDTEQQRTGALYRVGRRGAVELVWDGVGIPNACCFSPDGRTAYWGDSWDGAIHRVDLDPLSRPTGARRPFVTVEGPGVPDGACVDAEGCVWNAEWDGWRVVRYRPDGSVDAVLELPVQRPTCPAFGGPDLGTLYITTASVGLSGEQLAAQPWAGSVLAVDVRAWLGVTGVPEHRWEAR